MVPAGLQLRSATRPSRPPAWKNAFRRAWARGAQGEIESGDPRLRPGSWDGFGLLGRRIWRYRQKTETLEGGKPTFGGTAKCSFQHSAGYQMWGGGWRVGPLHTEEKGGVHLAVPSVPPNPLFKKYKSGILW